MKASQRLQKKKLTRVSNCSRINNLQESFGKAAKQSIDIEETFEPWNVKKTTILSKYTTSEKLSIMTSFLSGGEKG